METKDKTLVAKLEPKDWKLGDLEEFWKRQNEPDMARQCRFMMTRMEEYRSVGTLAAEKKVNVQFLGEIYNNAVFSSQPIRKGDILELPESQVKYLLETFPKNWQKVKVEKSNDESATKEGTTVSLRRG